MYVCKAQQRGAPLSLGSGAFGVLGIVLWAWCPVPLPLWACSRLLLRGCSGLFAMADPSPDRSVKLTSVSNKIPASRYSPGRLVQGCLVIFARFLLTAGETAMHRFESDAEVLALSTTQAAHLLQDYITPSGSWRMMTPGLANRTGSLLFDIMQTPASSWAHDLPGLRSAQVLL